MPCCSGSICAESSPSTYLSADTKDAVKLAMGLVATMSALVLGLLVTSVKGAYDTRKGEVIQMAAQVAFIDRVLKAYGPEADEVRSQFREMVEIIAGHLTADVDFAARFYRMTATLLSERLRDLIALFITSPTIQTDTKAGPSLRGPVRLFDQNQPDFAAIQRRVDSLPPLSDICSRLQRASETTER